MDNWIARWLNEWIERKCKKDQSFDFEDQSVCFGRSEQNKVLRQSVLAES